MKAPRKAPMEAPIETLERARHRSPRLLLSSVALVAVVALATVPAAFSQTAPSVVVNEPVHDLGVVEAGSTVKHTFVLSNRGDAPLEIVEVDPDCGCTVVRYDRTIAPGSSGKLTAEVDLSTFFGPIAKYLRVLTNDPATPELTLAVKVEVRPLVQAHPGYVRFLTVTGEEVEPADQVVWASDVDDFEVESARSPYRFVTVEVREATSSEERSEGQGKQWVIAVALAPDAPIGPMADHIEVATNHPKKPTLRIPISGYVRPVLAATPPFADFGAREITSPVRASVEIKNFSDDEIELTEVVSSLPQLDARIQVDGDDSYVIMVLNPGLPAGEFSGTVTVTTTSPRVPRIEIPVRGVILGG